MFICPLEPADSWRIASGCSSMGEWREGAERRKVSLIPNTHTGQKPKAGAPDLVLWLMGAQSSRALANPWR